MALMARFKRDIARHRGRSAVLAVLFLAFVAASVKMVFELRPATAETAARPTTPAKVDADAAIPVSHGEVESRLERSKRLWSQLRDVKPMALQPSVAFAFDARHYPTPPEPVRKPAVQEPEPVKAAPPMPVIDRVAEREKVIRDQARNLVLKTTALGNGGSRPMAIVNQQLLTIGQEMQGYELTAIRAREVEFVKEGVTVVVKMPEGQ
jgi:hypothetical protein